MRRSWSIRVRTALLFAVASMALTTAVLVFVNVASQQSFTRVFQREGTASAPASVDPAPPAAPAAPGWAAATALPMTSGPAPQPAEETIVSTVSTLQWQWSAIGVVAAGALAGGVGWLVTRRVLRPIDRITRAATRISASNLHERIALDGPDDELRRLSGTVDALLARLETAFESQRRFVAQASHELRTPLAVQRAALQIGLPDDATPDEIAVARGQLLDHNRRTEHLVESLLVLAQAERGISVPREALDLPAIVDQVTTAVQAERAGGARVVCVTRGEPPVGLTGEPTLVRQVVTNLVDNALEYNVPDGIVRVTVERSGLVVENTGPTVSDDAVGALTEPFRRNGVDGTRRHSGLGLSIVQAVVRAHGWTLAITPRPGGGLVVRVGVSPM
ncbi:sensor histidine kinase [Microbacterium sp. M1A1_1b]